MIYYFFFFFQAEDGIRYRTVTGVQTCALPILAHRRLRADRIRSMSPEPQDYGLELRDQIASLVVLIGRFQSKQRRSKPARATVLVNKNYGRAVVGIRPQNGFREHARALASAE